MACELIQREFPSSDGTSRLVGVRQSAASAALDLHIELMQQLGQLMFPLVENKYNFGDFLSIMRNGGDKLSSLIKRVIAIATVDGQVITEKTYDFHYSGPEKLMFAFKVFAFVLEANFLDFFKEGLELNEQRRLEAEEASAMEEQLSTSQ